MVPEMSEPTTTLPSASGATPSQQQAVSRKSDFMAAEEIKSILHDRQKAEQERIMRWVNESLGLSMIPTGVGPQSLSPPPLPPTTPSTHSEGHASSPHATIRQKDIKMFADEKQPKTDIQFAAVVAYYHRFEAAEPIRKGTITAEDLQEATRLAVRSRFKAPHSTLNNAVKQGYFDRAGRGEFKLNAVGENLVAMALPVTSEDTNGTTARRQQRKQSRKPRSQRGRKPNAS
jgi:hypothetical protein